MLDIGVEKTQFYRKGQLMTHWSRRKVLAGMVGAISLVFGRSGIAAAQPGGMRAARPLIDGHCHLFNITDIPASSFAQVVLLEHYPRRGGPTRRQRRVAAALRAIEAILSKGVPTAAQEIAVSRLPGRLLPAGVSPVTGAEERELNEQVEQAEAAQAEAPVGDVGPKPQGRQPTCEASSSPGLSLGSVRSWLGNLRARRATLAQKLARAQAQSGFEPRLLCPALVDYSNWLGQELRSPLPDQVVANGVLARDASLPAVHGYVAFDPLRRALIRTGLRTVDGSWDPLALARTALIDHGFLGVKLYPPMGFRPAGNAAARQGYPPDLEARFGGGRQLGAQLDRSLDELWQLCLALDAPIMAHGANSNAAGDDFGRRADPAYWLPVLERHPRLRVMVGHFGRFGTFSAGQPRDCSNGVPFDATWEATIGRFVSERPDSGLFADISYLSEIFDPRQRARSIAGMRRYLELDRGGRHLVFGSDWVMLGIEREYPRSPGYVRRIADFLNDCGLSENQIGGIMYHNALRFLGLGPSSAARRRLLAFYDRHGLPADRLPS